MSVFEKVFELYGTWGLKNSPGSHERVTQRESKPLASIRNVVKFLLKRAF